MTDPEQNTREFLEPYGRTHFYLACSGGVDSMVLLHILKKLGKDFTVLHVNYQLRGEDSEMDQNLIEDVCKAKNIPIVVKRINLQAQLEQHGGNLQDEARKVRYTFFNSFMTEAKSKIILAHHADDQIETFFLNLARDSGIMGLACMLPENKDYIRPLLTFSKDEIRFYAKKNKIEWREDKSNVSNKYRRNLLRNILIPQIKDEIPTFKQSVLTLTKIFQETQKELEKQIHPLAQKILKEQQLKFSLFDQLNDSECIELLRQMGLPSTLHNELHKLRHGIKGKRIDIEHPLFDKIIHEDGLFHFSEKNRTAISPKLKIETVNFIPSTFDKEVLYLDPSKISGSLKVRVWKQGDKMKPIGLKGTKLISDILSDAKVPNHLRHEQLVIHDDKHILSCVGFAVSSIAVSNGKGEILKVTLVK